MTFYAVDDVEDAIAATRAFLWPFDRGRWARLALVVFFVGGTGGANPLQFSGGTPPSGTIPDGRGAPGVPDALPSLGGPEIALIALVSAIVALLALGFVLVGSVMEFVFVESVSRETVTVRRYWRERWRQGLRLFGFRVVLGVLSLGIAGLMLGLAFAPVLFGNAALSLGVFFLAIPVFVVLAVVSGVVNGLTTGFVVPIMILEDRGLVAAWRRFWPTLTDQWKQFGVYVVARFVLQLAGGILTGIATLLGGVVLAIPLGIVGLVGFALLSVAPIAGWLVLGVAAVLFVLGVIALALVVGVPVQTFLRYYALLVLGDANEAFDLIAERRRAIRE